MGFSRNERVRLLLTRAAAESARTKAKLEAMGHTVLVSPVIEMVATGAPWPRGVVDAVLATSAQAFALLSEGPAPEARRAMPLFVVGDRTAIAAREAGFLGEAKIGETAAALAAMMRATSRGRLIYAAGRDRKPDMETALAEIGAMVDVLEVYQARAVGVLEANAAKALEAGEIDGVLHFSRRSAELFCRLAGAHDIRALAHGVLSDDVAAPLREAGCVIIDIAEAPNEAALLDRYRG